MFSFSESKKNHRSVIKHQTDISLDAVAMVRSTQVFRADDEEITSSEIHIHLKGIEMPVLLDGKTAETFKRRWEEYKLKNL